MIVFKLNKLTKSDKVSNTIKPFRLFNVLLCLSFCSSMLPMSLHAMTLQNMQIPNPPLEDQKSNSSLNTRPTLIASGHGEYPPFMYREGKNIIGVGVDITKLIFSELNINVDSIYVGAWSRVLRKAKSGEIDVVVGIYKTDERLTYLNYPQQPYIAEPVSVFFYHNNQIDYNHWQDLIGMKGGTVLGESFGQEFDSFAKKNLDIIRLSGITQSFKMLKRNRLQYSLYALYPGLIKIIDADMKGQILHSSNYVSTQNAYQAFSKKSNFIKHLPYFNNRVKELKADGSVQRFIDQHMKKLSQSENIKANK